MVTINKNESLFQTGIRDLPSYHLHHHQKNFFEKNSKISNFFCYHVFDGYKTKMNLTIDLEKTVDQTEAMLDDENILLEHLSYPNGMFSHVYGKNFFTKFASLNKPEKVNLTNSSQNKENFFSRLIELVKKKNSKKKVLLFKIKPKNKISSITKNQKKIILPKIKLSTINNNSISSVRCITNSKNGYNKNIGSNYYKHCVMKTESILRYKKLNI